MDEFELAVSRHESACVRNVGDGSQFSGEVDWEIVAPNERMVIDVAAGHSRALGADVNSGARREFESVGHGEPIRQPTIHFPMNDAQYERAGARRTKLTTTTVSKESVLSKLQKWSCLDLRQLAALHGVDAANETLSKAVADLRRRGKIACIGGRGARASFVLATFES